MSGPEFHISSFCNSNFCVAVAFTTNSVLVRHHRSGSGGPTLEFTFAEWKAFTAGVHRGEFEAPGDDMPRKPDGRVDLDAMYRTGSKDSNALVASLAIPDIKEAS